VRVVGRTGPLRIYEPLGLAGEVTDEAQWLMKAYAEGLRCWRAQDFAGASRSFESISEIDPPACFFVQRCRQLMQQPPTPGWDHVHALETK
jgi:adenylate cyclase